MTLRAELREYADRSAGLIDDSPQMDEENTKRKVIEPLVEALGWDILSQDVELEYSVQMGTGTKKVDYALKLEDTPVVFVEAKGCDTALEESHENQLKSYMRQVGVDWGLLTNGRRFAIFRRDASSSRPNEIRLATFGIDDVPENEHPLRALSRSSISSGESRQIAESIEAVHDAVASLRTNKESLAEDVTAVVTDVTGSAVAQQVEDEAKSFVDDLIDSLGRQAHRNVATSQPTAIERTSTAAPRTDRESAEYGVRLTRNGEEVASLGADLQSEAMATVVSYLIEEEGLLDAVAIPYVPGTGRGTRALLNDVPEHTNGKEMKTYQQVADDYYLHTNLPADQKQRYLTELCRKAEVDCEFVGGW